MPGSAAAQVRPQLACLLWAGGALTLVAAVVVFVLEQRRQGVRVRLDRDSRRLTVAPKIEVEPEPALQGA